MPEQQQAPLYETQKERWIKYGANVVLASIVVILIAGIITYLAQKTGRRVDTTNGGMYSLKAQTLNLIGDLPGKTKIVSLYTGEIPDEHVRDKMVKSPYVGPVADLLDEYRRKGKNIEVDSIDPVQNPSKVDNLITEVTNTYGGEVKKYNEALDAYPKVYDQIKALSLAEAEKIAKLQPDIDKLGDDDDSQTNRAAIITVRGLPKQLETSADSIERRRKQKPPDLKGAVNNVEDLMDILSQTAAKITEVFNKEKSDAKLPPELAKYMGDPATLKTYADIKKLADDLLKQVKGVGELKLDDLRQSLRARDAILVMYKNGDKADMRVIPFEQVWKADDAQIKQYNPGQEIKPRFAGEQQITTALLSLSSEKKPKVCFVRTGGPPLTTPGMLPFQRGGPMSAVADALRAYNFEVLEKDLSGMWAMQAQMQQMPSPPEPTDEQIKDAIWIVLNVPMQQQQSPMGPPPSIAPKVAEHLKSGGSAMIMFAPKTDNMDEILKEWGIQVKSEAVAVHQLIKQGEGRQGDMMEDALRYPFVFDIHNYGDSLITKPIQSLSSLFLPLEVVQVAKQAPAGVKVTPIIPVPQSPESWGETDLDALENLNDIKFDAAKDVKNDADNPIYGGAVAEKDKAGRLVVIASPMFAFDRWVNEPDPNMLRRGLIVSRFPANKELFDNSVFWLAHMEPLIAISPAAMEVARIEPMSEGGKAFWKTYILLVLLPGAVVAVGVGVYFMRRD